MSLRHIALRIAALEALRGRTIAGDLVIDTDGDIGDSDANAPRFSIAVGLLDASDKLVRLALTLSVWKRGIVESEPDANGNVTGFYAWMPAVLDAPAQLALDWLEHQALAALKPGTPWGEVWAKLATSVETTSGRSADGAARRVVELAIVPATDGGAGWLAFHDMVRGSNSLPGPLKTLVIDKLPDWAALGLDCGLALEPPSVRAPTASSDAAGLAARSAKPKTKRKGRGR